MENQPRFSISLMHIVASDDVDLNTRLAGALFFKNFIKRRWTDEDGNYLIPQQDVHILKTEIIGLMVQLPKTLRSQVGEAVSIMAESDFPSKWPELFENLVSRLSNDATTNIGVLTVAHEVCKRWRPLFRSDELFTEIKLVLGQFCEPYLGLLKNIDLTIQQGGAQTQLEQLLEAMHLLVELFIDLNCQDIPEFFEDHMEEIMEIFHRYLVYKAPSPLGDDDSDEVTIVETLKASIFEALQMYTLRYEDVFGKLVPHFVQTTWGVLTELGLSAKYDIVVSKGMALLTAVATNQRQNQIFDSESVLDDVVRNIVVPNMTLREADEEMFEDEPLEFIRRDLEGSDSDTRRRSATDLIRKLAESMEAKVTSVVMKYISAFLGDFAQNSQRWREKDTAIYLFSSIAAKGNVTTAGVSSTNLLVNVVDFFVQNVQSDLTNTSDSASPILKTDAIKYIHTFRNQLTKEQLLNALPLLASHMHPGAPYVVYTYAAITIERILSVRVNVNSSSTTNAMVVNTPPASSNLIQKSDIAPYSKELLIALFSLILKDTSSPEKLAENEFLMKTVMRVLITCQDSVEPYAGDMLTQLVQIVQSIARNPSNPKFSHYTFEALGAVLRYGNIDSQTQQQSLVSEMMTLLANDVTEFVPYVFQILTQIISSLPPSTQLPPDLASIVRPLMVPSLWEAKGNTPALVGLVEAILTRGSQTIMTTDSFKPLLGVFQKLISSKKNDKFGFDLLEQIYVNIPLSELEPVTGEIAVILLQRLQTSRTREYVNRFARFIYFLSAVGERKPELGADFAVSFIDKAQQGLFGRIFEQFILPATGNIGGHANHRIAIIGLAKLLCQSSQLVSQYSSTFPLGLKTLLDKLKVPLPDPVSDGDVLIEAELDMEELTFGASYAKLVIISRVTFEPAPNVKNIPEYVVGLLKHLAQQSQQVYQIIAQLPDEYKSYLAGLGFA